MIIFQLPCPNTEQTRSRERDFLCYGKLIIDLSLKGRKNLFLFGSKKRLARKNYNDNKAIEKQSEKKQETPSSSSSHKNIREKDTLVLIDIIRSIFSSLKIFDHSDVINRQREEEAENTLSGENLG